MSLNFVQSSTVFWAEKIMRKSLANHLVIKPVKEKIKRNAKPGHTYMLYIHVPFCHTFCSYCSFHKFYYDEEKALQYFSFVRDELRKVKEQGYDFETLYVGGGTTLINEPELIKTLEYAKSLFSIKEVSCESDPNHIAPDSLRRFRGLIDRLSIGVQSFDNDILKRIGRYEKFGSGEEIQDKLLKMAGVVPTTSIDLIFNFPGQTEDQLLRDVVTVQAMDVDQVTTYPLMQSNLMKQSISKAFDGQKNNSEYRFYKLIRDAMNQYRPVNGWAFSRQEEKMSDEYVGSHSEYIGVGSGSFSFLEGTLYVNAFDLDEYMYKIANEESAIVASCAFTPKERVQYQFMTSLFDGMVDIAQFNQMLQTNVERAMGKEITMLKLAGAIEVSDGVIVPTEFGSYVSLVLMREFYSGMDGVRAMFRPQSNMEKVVNL